MSMAVNESFYLSRTLMEGDKQGGFSVFWADDGLDTGPILLQKSVNIDPNDTVDTLYNRFLYPEGIKGMVGEFSTIQCVDFLWVRIKWP